MKNLSVLKQQYLIFSAYIYQVIQFTCKVLIGIMVFSVSYAVVGRFILRSTPRWCEEVGILCMVWVGFLASTLAIRDGNHIRMTVLERILPKPLGQALHICAYLILLILNVVWVRYGAEIIALTANTKMASTQLPQSYLYGSVAVAGFLGIFMTLARLVKGDW